jgi:hypothetical protein
MDEYAPTTINTSGTVITVSFDARRHGFEDVSGIDLVPKKSAKGFLHGKAVVEIVITGEGQKG